MNESEARERLETHTFYEHGDYDLERELKADEDAMHGDELDDSPTLSETVHSAVERMKEGGRIGVWVTYYGDMSSCAVWGSEIEALRDAVGGSKLCRFVKWGEEIRSIAFRSRMPVGDGYG